MPRHIVHCQCFDEGVLGHGCLPSKTETCPVVLDKSLVDTRASSVCDLNSSMTWGSFLHETGTVSTSSPFILLYSGRKAKSVFIFTGPESKLNLGIKSLFV